MIAGIEVPISGIAKKYSSMFLHNNASGGDATLESTYGTLSTRWPECKLTGQGPRASVYAAGVKPPLLSALELQTYIPTTPTKDELAHEFIGMDNVPIDAIWQTIQAKGWDAAVQRAEAKGVDLKAEWKHVTGEQYGSKKGETWKPEGYWGHTVADLEEQVKSAKAAYETALKQQAVSDHQLAELQELAEQPLDTFDGRVLSLKERLELTESNWRAAVEETRKATVPTDTESPLTCPECETPLTFNAGKLAKQTGKKPTKKQQQSAIDRYNEAKAFEEELLAAYQQAVADAAEAERDAEKARNAREAIRVKQMETIPVDQALALLESVQSQLDMAKAKTQADELHQQIFQNTYMQAVLGPDGLRRQKLLESLKGFNEVLASVSAKATWGTVALDDDLIPTLNGKPYRMLSASEQFRVNVTLQCVLAMIDGSQMIVIDAADILDRWGRNGLISLLSQIEIPSVVTMTFNSADDAPDLASRGLGVTHWIGAREAVTV